MPDPARRRQNCRSSTGKSRQLNNFACCWICALASSRPLRPSSTPLRPPPARVQLSELFERLLQFFVAQSPLIAGAPRKTVQFSSKLRHREKRMKIPLLVTLVGLAISFTSCSPTSGYNGRIQGASGPGSVGTNPSQRGIYPGNPNGAGRGFFFALGNGQSIAP